MSTTQSINVEDKILELRCVRRELDEALYYDAPEYVIDRICERLNPLEREVNQEFDHA